MVFRLDYRATVVGLLAIMGIGMAQNSVADTTTLVAKITERQTALGVNLLKQDSGESNSVISPYSVYSSLMLARLGAVGEAATALDESLATAKGTPAAIWGAYRELGAQVIKENGVTTAAIANSIWITDQGVFKEVFEKRASEYLAASSQRVSFKDPNLATQKVNAWVSERTHGKIPELIQPGMFHVDSVAALVNALHFKAPWRSAFSPDSTITDTFTVKTGTTKQVPMMWVIERYRYFEDANWQVVNLPFEGELYGFLLLVPKSDLPIEKVRDLLSADLLSKASRSAAPARVSVHMPRFTIRQSRELSKSLTQLGLGILFSPKADFSEITSLPLKISDIQHEAVIEVAEHGVEAAAATAVTFSKGLAPTGQEEPKEINANHPFAFAIVHNSTQAPLFLGVIGDPT